MALQTASYASSAGGQAALAASTYTQQQSLGPESLPSTSEAALVQNQPASSGAPAAYSTAIHSFPFRSPALSVMVPTSAITQSLHHNPAPSQVICSLVCAVWFLSQSLPSSHFVSKLIGRRHGFALDARHSIPASCANKPPPGCSQSCYQPAWGKPAFLRLDWCTILQHPIHSAIAITCRPLSLLTHQKQVLHRITLILEGASSRKATGQEHAFASLSQECCQFLRDRPNSKQLCRVVITSSSRKMNQAVVGKEGQVTQVLTNGWVNLFIPALRLNEQVQQRYLAHVEPGRVVQADPAHPASNGMLQQQPITSEAALMDFPELPNDLDGLVSGLDGDLFLETSHAMSLGETDAA